MTSTSILEERVARQVEEIESARQLRRYLSPQVVEAVMSGQKLEMTTTRKEATVFFSDVRGFTALSEQLEPEELIDIMNQYLSAMTEIVFRFEGTLPCPLPIAFLDIRWPLLARLAVLIVQEAA